MRRSKRSSFMKPRTGVLGFLVCLVSLAALAPAVQASKGIYDVFGSFGSGPGQFSSYAAGIAVNPASGDVYVVDVENARVERFDADGNFLSAFGTPGAADGQFDFASSPSGIAIDSSDGSVYVADAGNNRIQKFTAGGSFSLAFGSAGAGSGELNGPRGVAVDPSSGEVYVADTGNNRVQKFDSTGSYIGQFGSQGSDDGQFSGPTDIAVDSTGDVYVLEPFIRVQRFDSAGTFEVVFAPSELAYSPRAMTVDPSSDHVFVNQNTPDFSSYVVVELDSSGVIADTHQAVSGYRLAVNSTSERIYVGEYQRVFIIDETNPAPEGSTSSATDITDTSATLNGTLDPNGPPGAEYYFDYSTDGSNWTATPSSPLDGGKGNSPISVSEPVQGLEPNIEYRYRLRYRKRFSEAFQAAPEQNFTTAPLPPDVKTRSAGVVTDSTAILRGVVDPNNDPTTYFFEYGSTAAYGLKVPVVSTSAGGGGEPIPVAAEITGLVPNATYHYRLVAENSFGSGGGDDSAFTTLTSAAAALAPRGLELVNPPEKANQNPQFPLLMPEGDEVIWQTLSGSPNSSSGAGGTYSSERTAAGWKTSGLEPPISEMIGGGDEAYQLRRISSDRSSFIFEVGGTLVGSQSDRRIVRIDADGNQEVLHLFPEGSISNVTSITSSDDLEHVFINTIQPIDPNHQPGEQLYDFGSGTPELVSRLPDGSVPACGLSLSNSGSFQPSTDPYRFHSRDGSRVFFSSRGDSCDSSVDPDRLYVRNVETDTTTLISTPPMSGPEGNSFFVRANPQGTEALFTSTSNLVAEDTDTEPQLYGPAGKDVYLWSEQNGLDCLTCVVANADVFAQDQSFLRSVLSSVDLKRFYFISSNVLTASQPAVPGYALYVWHDGQIEYVGPSSPVQTNGLDWSGGSTVTPDGGTLVYRSEVLATPDAVIPSNGRCTRFPGEPPACANFYRFELSTRSLECITCPLPGKATGDAYSIEGVYMNRMESTGLSEDGQTFAFTSSAALVPDDVNGDFDVYEWHKGRNRLITDGVSEYGSPESPGGPKIVGISADGKDIIFRLGAKLTGHEVEEAPQLYDARMGGGFAPPPVPPPACVEDSCQGPLVSPPDVAAAGSGTLRGIGNRTDRAEPRRQARRCSRHRKRPGTVRGRKGNCKRGGAKGGGK